VLRAQNMTPPPPMFLWLFTRSGFGDNALPQKQNDLAEGIALKD